MNHKRYRVPAKKRMPKEAAITRDELRNAISNHLAVILPDAFDDLDVIDMTTGVIAVIEDCINYMPRKDKPGESGARKAARERAKRGGLPVLTSEAHGAIDTLLRYFEHMVTLLVDSPDYQPLVNEILGKAKIAKAWIDSQPIASDDAVGAPVGVAETLRGLLESAIAGTESTIRTRNYHGLRKFSTTEEEWIARYKAALAWLDSKPKDDDAVLTIGEPKSAFANPATYKGFTITAKPFGMGRDGRPRYTWQIVGNGVSIPIMGTSGYRSEKLALGFAKDYINERSAAIDVPNYD